MTFAQTKRSSLHEDGGLYTKRSMLCCSRWRGWFLETFLEFVPPFKRRVRARAYNNKNAFVNANRFSLGIDTWSHLRAVHLHSVRDTVVRASALGRVVNGKPLDKYCAGNISQLCREFLFTATAIYQYVRLATGAKSCSRSDHLLANTAVCVERFDTCGQLLMIRGIECRNDAWPDGHTLRFPDESATRRRICKISDSHSVHSQLVRTSRHSSLPTFDAHPLCPRNLSRKHQILPEGRTQLYLARTKTIWNLDLRIETTHEPTVGTLATRLRSSNIPCCLVSS